MEGRDLCVPGQVQDGGLCKVQGLETGRERNWEQEAGIEGDAG